MIWGGYVFKKMPTPAGNIHRYIAGASGKESTCQCKRRKRHGFSPWVRKIPLEKEMATRYSILAWRIPWTVEPGGLQSMELQSRTWLSTYTQGRYIYVCVCVCMCIYIYVHVYVYMVEEEDLWEEEVKVHSWRNFELEKTYGLYDNRIYFCLLLLPMPDL